MCVCVSVCKASHIVDLCSKFLRCTKQSPSPSADVCGIFDVNTVYVQACMHVQAHMFYSNLIFLTFNYLVVGKNFV